MPVMTDILVFISNIARNLALIVQGVGDVIELFSFSSYTHSRNSRDWTRLVRLFAIGSIVSAMHVYI